MDSTEINLRPGRESDLPQILAIHNHYVRETAITFETMEGTLDNREKWFRQFDETGPHRMLVAVAGDSVLGYANSGPFHERPAYVSSVMTSVYLHPDQTGQGIGEKLYRALLDSLEKTEQAHRAYGLVVLPNLSSERLHEKLGFRKTGLLQEAGYKFDAYHSVHIYELELD